MRILYIMPSFNLYGGTPKKTLDLMKYFGDKSSIYVYTGEYKKFRSIFENTGGGVYVGDFQRNIYKHIKMLIDIVDKEKIDVVQTQFFMGTVLGYFVKLFRNDIKLIVTFEAAIKQQRLKRYVSHIFYRAVDCFVFISDFVKSKIIEEYPKMVGATGRVIHNGSRKLPVAGYLNFNMQENAFLCVSGLVPVKNIQILVETFSILVYVRAHRYLNLYIAGDGDEKPYLEALIKSKGLQNNIFLLGYNDNIGLLLEQSFAYLHPSFAEGFGIAVVEAMLAGKPVIASNVGALPEIIENEENGLLVDPFKPEEWANAVERLLEKDGFAELLGERAARRANEKFSADIFTSNYEKLYTDLLFEPANSSR